MIWKVAESDVTSKSSHVTMKEKQEYFCGLSDLTESWMEALIIHCLLSPYWYQNENI